MLSLGIFSCIRYNTQKWNVQICIHITRRTNQVIKHLDEKSKSHPNHKTQYSSTKEVKIPYWSTHLQRYRSISNKLYFRRCRVIVNDLQLLNLLLDSNEHLFSFVSYSHPLFILYACQIKVSLFRSHFLSHPLQFRKSCLRYKQLVLSILKICLSGLLSYLSFSLCPSCPDFVQQFSYPTDLSVIFTELR